MASPFPGMDPYIEAYGLWEDFHTNLIGEIQRALLPNLPEKYVARTGERSYLLLLTEEGKEKEHDFLPDVAIKSSRRRKHSRGKKPDSAVAL